VAKAITVARRMLDSRGKAALQIVASLSRYYLEIARLESGEATNDVEAGELLGKSKYPAGKQLQVANRLGSQRIAQALRWITESDLALKGGVSYGGKDLESDMDVTELTVIEVLVARLARLHQAAKRR
jgi:DNA polymerase III delta subunit